MFTSSIEAECWIFFLDLHVTSYTNMEAILLSIFSCNILITFLPGSFELVFRTCYFSVSKLLVFLSLTRRVLGIAFYIYFLSEMYSITEVLIRYTTFWISLRTPPNMLLGRWYTLV